LSSPTLYGGRMAEIAGTQHLQPGAHYFYCTIHGFGLMRGTLNIVGEGAVPRPTVGGGETVIAHRTGLAAGAEGTGSLSPQLTRAGRRALPGLERAP
jgi:hypothetical protein